MSPETGNAASTRAENAERGSEGWIFGMSGVVNVGIKVVSDGERSGEGSDEVAGRFRFLEGRIPSSKPEGSLRPVRV